MDARSLLVELVAAGEALTRGHSPVCVCADCAATRAAVRGGAAVVERAAVARDALRARRAGVRVETPRVEARRPELGPVEARRGAFLPGSALGPVEEVHAEVVARPPWER